jgi:hypothetical protein
MGASDRLNDVDGCEERRKWSRKGVVLRHLLGVEWTGGFAAKECGNGEERIYLILLRAAYLGGEWERVKTAELNSNTDGDYGDCLVNGSAMTFYLMCPCQNFVLPITIAQCCN